MRKFAAIAVSVCVMFGLGFAQTAEIQTDAQGLVTITARGTDVRPLLHDLFAQAKKNYVLEATVRQNTYLSLAGVEFEEALQIICKLLDLQYEVQNGIYFLSKNVNTSGQLVPVKVTPPQGKVSQESMAKKVTTRFAKTELALVLADLSKQTGVKIELDKATPKYKIDAFLVGTSLKYALDVLTKATGLEYRLTDNCSIFVCKPEANKSSVMKAGKAH